LAEIENKLKLGKHSRKHVAQTVKRQQQQQLVTNATKNKKQRKRQTKKLQPQMHFVEVFSAAGAVGAGWKI